MKKTMLKKRFYLFLIAVLLAVTGCQTEDFTVESKRLEDISSRKITLDEMSKETGAVTAVAPFIKGKTDNVLARNLVYNSKYGFYVDTDEILMKQRGDDISFTLLVYRDNVESKLENLVLTKQTDGTYAVFLLKYNLTAGEKENLLNNQQITDLNDKTEFFMLTNASRSSNNDDSFHEGDIIKLPDGRCMRLHHVTSFQDGTFAVTGVIVTCAPEEPSSTNLNENGDGSGNPSFDVWFYIPIHSWTQGPVGNPSNPGVGGSSPDNDPDGDESIPPTLTEPLILAGETPNPCDVIAKLKTDVLFKQKMENLETATGYNFEQLFTAYANTNPNSRPVSNFSFSGFSGTVFEPTAKYNYGTNILGLMHSHYEDQLSIYSVDDLYDIYIKMKNPLITNNYFSALVTKAGTRYLLTVSDRIKFIAFGDIYLADEPKRNKLIKKCEEKYSINNGGANQVNEKGFVKMLSKLAGGLDVYTGNIDFSNWKKLTYDEQNDNVTLSDCN